MTSPESDRSSSPELHDLDLEAQDPFDYEDPLMFPLQLTAVLSNDVPRLKKLLDSGKSVNITDNSGNTPLHTAVVKCKRAVFDYLLTVEDLRIDCANFEGMTPLLVAVMCHYDYLVLELVKKGADVNIARNSGDTPLHYATYNPLSVPQALIGAGADLNARNCRGETPLFEAVRGSHSDLVHLLLYYGANVTIPDNGGLLPFSLSLSRRGLEDLRRVLFDSTFDDCKDEVSLKNVKLVMELAPDYFGEMLGKIGGVHYDLDDLTALSDSLTGYDTNMVVRLLVEFPELAEDFLQVCTPVTMYQDCLVLGRLSEIRFDFIAFFYFLSASGLITEVVQNHKTEFLLAKPLVSPKFPEEVSWRMLSVLLSHGIEMTARDLDLVYKYYGYTEFFKILLHMDFVDYPIFIKKEVLTEFFLPRLIYDLDLRIEMYTSPTSIFYDRTSFKRVSKFFVVPKVADFYSVLNEDEIKKLPKVPSLVEFSRNSVRLFLIDKFRIKNNVQFFTMLKWLPIAETYKQIIAYEKPIYN